MSDRQVSKRSRTVRDTNGLRSALFDALDDLRAGKISSTQACAVAGLAGQIVNVTRLEMAHARYLTIPEVGMRTFPAVALEMLEQPGGE